TVGVFVNQPLGEIEQIALDAGLSAVQLHGDEDRGFASRLSRPVIKAVSAGLDRVDWPAHVTLLVDAHDPEQRGGTGRKADWAGAAALAKTRRVMLAGGLTAGNVAAAVAAVRP